MCRFLISPQDVVEGRTYILHMHFIYTYKHPLFWCFGFCIILIPATIMNKAEIRQFILFFKKMSIWTHNAKCAKLRTCTWQWPPCQQGPDRTWAEPSHALRSDSLSLAFSPLLLLNAWSSLQGHLSSPNSVFPSWEEMGEDRQRNSQSLSNKETINFKSREQSQAL